MATAREQRSDVTALTRSGTILAVCTLGLTASFVGLVALLSGQADGLAGRLALYVLCTATAFVGTILVYETQGVDGMTVLPTAGGVALCTFLFLTLGGEGVVYITRHPEQLLGSQLGCYFLAAGMVGTGLGYWGIKHWQELGMFRTGSVGPTRRSSR